MDLATDTTVRRSYGVVVKSIDVENRCVDVIASTDAIDSYGEIVDQSWDLDRYLANPVVLYNHNREGWIETLDPEYTLPIGSSKNVGVVDGKLQATLCFVTSEASPMAELVWQAFKQGSLRAVSVGFNPRNVAEEKRDGKTIFRLSDNELFEISVCPMGANPEAVAKSRQKSIDQLRRLAAAQPHPTKENDMKTIEQLEAELAVAKSATTDAQKALEASKAENSVLADQVKTLTAERDAARAKSTKLEDEIVLKEVDALVGVKFDAAQRDKYLDFARADLSRFRSIVADLPTKSTLGKVVPSDPETKSSAGESVDSGQDLASAINAKAATITA